ncbi:hypothetical protein JCM6882_000709 [Rhodosporidiobolus microsporus]
MRSFTLLAAHHSPLPSSSSSSAATSSSPAFTLAATTVDAATDTNYALRTSAALNADGEVDVEVYRLAPPSRGGAGVVAEPELLTFFSTPAHPLAASPPPSSSSSPALAPPHLVVSFHYQPEDDALAIVLSNGEVEQVFLQGGAGEPRRENVGTFDTGIKAAAWSPDDELLSIITGDNLLLLLTRLFDPLHESPLHTTTFGTDAPVSVGWGQKSTQFHGSLGKTAAAAAAKLNPLDADVLLSPEDDRKTRIVWRGDSAWFAVSSVELAPERAGEAEGQRREVRRVRIFARSGEHSSTSEPVPGLEGALAWMPSGEILASTQRKVLPSAAGAEGEAEKVELQVVFFERNGLRRYEFPLREREEMVRQGRVRVREVGWNSGSDVLAVWVERDGEAGEKKHAVQLYHRSNYHWYLKQEISPRLAASTSLQGFVWHPEKALELSLLTSDGLEDYIFSWDTFCSARSAPFDDGTVAVVDGADTKLTPFRLINVPPPMSGLVLSSPSSHRAPPTHIAFSPSTPSLSSAASPASPPPVLFALIHASAPSPTVFLYSWALALPSSPSALQAAARAGLPAPVLEWSVALDPNAAEAGRGVVKQCAVVGHEAERATVAVLRTLPGGGGDEVVMVRRDEGVRRVGVMEGARRIVPALGKVGEEGDEEGFVLETAEGELLEIPLTAQDGDFALPSPTLSPLPEFCPHLQHVLLPSSLSPSSSSPILLPTLIALAPSGRLYASSRQLASDATSFALTPDFLIYTTFSHEAKFVPLSSLSSPSGGDGAYTESFARRAAPGAGDGSVGGGTVKRAVERGSRIVAVVPSSTSLVLQMPRGNLETVCPRPLVVRVVRGFLDSHRFRSAFLLCRKHRIDLNLLHDHDPASFRTNLPEFVSQIKDVDHLNLFLSGLKDEDVRRTMYRELMGGGREQFDASNKVNTICDLVRRELEGRDVFHYANTILTAHVRKRPPAYEDALQVLVELKAKDPERAEDAVKYIIFLSDANKLFDLALGMYDFPLVLMVAQQSQKDPREYLPFLRALRALPPFLQRHKIDDYLGRHDSALRNLSKAGEEHFEDALAYCKKHGLYEVALEAYAREADKYQVILCANAEYLFDKSKYSQAGLLFQLGGQTDKALLAYQRAHAWQELFTLALSAGVVQEEIKEMAVDVAENLVGKRRYAEAARVLLEYGQDVESAVQALCEGNLYSEAIRLISLHSRSDLLESHIEPSTLDMQQRLVDDMSDLTEQLEKQVKRLADLKVKCEQNPYQYFCIDDPAAALENVELAPDGMSDAGTAFTRYTVAPTTMASQTSRGTSKTSTSKRRQALKKAAGKKSSVYEEMYLLNSMKKTVESKLAELQTDAAALLPVLLTLRSSDHRSAAIELQTGLSSFEAFLSATVSTIWDPLERAWRQEQEEDQRVRDSGDPVRLAEWEARPRPVEGEEETKRVERPALPKGKWRLGVVDAAAKAEGA